MESKKKKTKQRIGFGQSITNSLASIVDFHDRVQEHIDSILIGMFVSLVKEYHDGVSRYKDNQRDNIINIFLLVVVICAMLLTFDYFTVYQYSYNGRVLGYVDNQENVYNMLQIAGDKLSEANGTQIVFETDQNITFKKVSSNGRDIDDADTVLNKLTYMTDIEITAYGIYSDNKLAAIVRSEMAAKSILEMVKSRYNEADNGMEIVDIGYENVIEIKPVESMLTSIQTTNDAIELLTNGGTVKLQHIVSEDENLDVLAEEFSADKKDIYEGNSSKPARKVTPGDKVSIKSNVKPLIVDVIEHGTKSEKINYSVQKIKDTDLYIGDEEVEREGKNGKQTITGTIYKQNGVEIARDIEKSEVIREPVNKIIKIGATQRPKTAPTGTFVMPIHQYVISSYFGSRWGTIHGGMDFAAPVGTPIYASDGGKVIRAEYYGGYGLCVEIEHKNGTFTRYGHCSQTFVTVGQDVYQGQEICYVGNTGRSTGPHLHFEIHPGGGAYVDPLPYLPIGQGKSDN